MEITFSDNVPIPTYRKNKYPFDKLQIDQSFLLTGDDLPKNPLQTIRCAYNAFVKRQKKQNLKPFKFTARAEGDGVRVWRVE